MGLSDHGCNRWDGARSGRVFGRPGDRFAVKAPSVFRSDDRSMAEAVPSPRSDRHTLNRLPGIASNRRYLEKQVMITRG